MQKNLSVKMFNNFSLEIADLMSPTVPQTSNRINHHELYDESNISWMYN